MSRFRTFMIILVSFAIVWCGAGAFYRATQEDVLNTIINLVFCVIDMLWLTFFIHGRWGKND